MAPSTRKGQIAGTNKTNAAHPPNVAKRRSVMTLPFQVSNELSFLSLLKKNARDLTIKFTSDDNLVLSFKSVKQDLGIEHAAMNEVILPFTKAAGGHYQPSHKKMRSRVYKVKTDGFKRYCPKYSSSQKSTCCDIPKDKEEFREEQKFDLGVAGTSKDNAAIYGHNSGKDCAVMTSSHSDRRHRMGTTIVRRRRGKSCSSYN